MFWRMEATVDTNEDLELICPACGALIEAPTMTEMVERARAHTLDAHNYEIPEQHVIDACRGEQFDH